MSEATPMHSSMVNAFDPGSQVPASSSLSPLPRVSSEAKAILRSGANVRRCLDELMSRGLTGDALTIVARMLPKRYVVAWACDCLKSVPMKESADAGVDRAGLALAQAWLAEPSEENRRAAMDFAEAGEFASAGAWIAASAGWCGGSLAPRGYDVVAPPDHLPAEAAVAALKLAASRCEDDAGVTAGFITRALKLFGAPARREEASA